MNVSPEFPIPNKSNTLNYNAYLLLTDTPLWTGNERFLVLLIVQLKTVSKVFILIYDDDGDFI